MQKMEKAGVAGQDIPTEVPIHVVDAFASAPFTGNPAAVCLLDSDNMINDETKQKIAAEMNLSETAFVSCKHEFQDFLPKNSFSTSEKFLLRWFTPTVEVDLCGHATLATAAVIFKVCDNIHQEIKFETRSGTLLASLTGNFIALNFPETIPQPLSDALKTELSALTDICAVLGQDSIVDVVFAANAGKLLVRLKDTVTMAELTNLPVDPNLLFAAHQSHKVRGVIFTVKGSRENGSVDKNGKVYDFISRYFAPWVGINEDPVTGSAHTVLVPFWGDLLKKDNLFARQCSKRGGELTLRRDQVNNRVELAGDCRLVLSGRLSF